MDVLMDVLSDCKTYRLRDLISDMDSIPRDEVVFTSRGVIYGEAAVNNLKIRQHILEGIRELVNKEIHHAKTAIKAAKS
jgi:hypothetical protein